MTQEKIERAKAFTKKYHKYENISLVRNVFGTICFLSLFSMWFVLKYFINKEPAGIIAMIVAIICAIGFIITLIWSLIIYTQLKQESANEKD